MSHTDTPDSSGLGLEHNADQYTTGYRAPSASCIPAAKRCSIEAQPKGRCHLTRLPEMLVPDDAGLAFAFSFAV
jgi:hypothetical protein